MLCFAVHRVQRRELVTQGTLNLQRRWLQQNPFGGAVLDDPTLPLPRFIRDTPPPQPQQSQTGTSRKAEPVALRDALQSVKVLEFVAGSCAQWSLDSVCGAPGLCANSPASMLVLHAAHNC